MKTARSTWRPWAIARALAEPPMECATTPNRDPAASATATPAMHQGDRRALAPGPCGHSPIVHADAERPAGCQEIADRWRERRAGWCKEEALGESRAEARGGAFEGAHRDTSCLELQVHRSNA